MTQGSKRGAAHRVEWATGFVSAVIVLAMICWVGWQALTESEAPPEFVIVLTGEGETPGGYRVTFDIANSSALTAATVVVRGEIIDGGQQASEMAEVTFDYVPGQSKASGALFFSQPPGTRRIRLRAVGYTEP